MAGCGCGEEGFACKTNQNVLWSSVAFMGGVALTLGPYAFNGIKSGFDIAYVFVDNFCKAKMPNYYSYLSPVIPSFSSGLIMGAAGTALAAGIYYGQKYYLEYTSGPTYLPFATSYEEAEQKNCQKKSVKISDNLVEGHRSQANVVEVTKENSHIWMKGGLNYVKLSNEGGNSLYFSLCSTKVFSGRVSVVEGFKASDKIYFFCSVNPNIDKEKDIVIHNNVKYNEQIFTCVEVKGKENLSPVCLLGDIDFSMNNLGITNLEQVHAIFGW